MAHNDQGLFQPFTRRMSKKMKDEIFQAFLDRGEHYSRSGLTARIIVDRCLLEKKEFTVHWVPRLGYTVKHIPEIPFG